MLVAKHRRRGSAFVPALLDRRLLSYAIAAGAALAASTPSTAEVLFTPNNSFLKPPSSLAIDLNHDGVADFRLDVREIFETSSSFAYGFVGGALAYGNGPSNRFAGSTWAISPLKRGEQIGSQLKFWPIAVLAEGLHFWGPFDNTQNKFLGVKLVVGGEVHFGWIGFRRVDANKTVQVTLAGWAYETVPDKGILAGDTGRSGATIQPTSLEVLSFGYGGIAERSKRATSAGGSQ